MDMACARIISDVIETWGFGKRSDGRTVTVAVSAKLKVQHPSQPRARGCLPTGFSVVSEDGHICGLSMR